MVLVLAEATPNPSTLKFVPPRGTLRRETAEFTKGGASPPALAEALLRVDGVERVLFGGDFVAVTSDGRDWGALREAVSSIIAAHALGEASHEPPGHAGSPTGADDTLVGRIKATLDSRIRRSVAVDGGDVTFVDFTDGILTLRLHGACKGCPSSSATLRHGILATMHRLYPEIVDVRSV